MNLFVFFSFLSLLSLSQACTSYTMEGSGLQTKCLGRGYYMDAWTCNCFICDPHCLSCLSKDICGECSPGYSLTPNYKCTGLAYILDLQESTLSVASINSFTFQNAPSASKTINYLGKDYLGGVDPGRVIFTKTYATPKLHYALVVNFMALEFPGLKPTDRLNLYADGSLVYSHDPTSFSGFGPEAERIQFSHNKPQVTLAWV